MGILRDSPSAVRYPTLDPFEICDDVMIEKPATSTASTVAPSPIADSPRRGPVRSNKATKTAVTSNCTAPAKISLFKRARATCKYVVLCFLSIGAVTFLAKIKPWSYFSQPDLVFAYFEVRALDGNGHPIAGAVVKNSGKRVGTTDSFGEWRRYMQVPLGSTIPISLTKKTPNQLLFVSKNFAVPPVKQEKNEIELRSSVQLMPAEQTSVDAHGDVLVQTPQLTGVTTTNQAEPSKFEVSKVAPALQAGSQASMSDLDSIWFFSTDLRIERELVPALVLRAKELGLKIEKNAAWQVQLTNLIDKPTKIAKDGGGLILVNSALAQSSQQSSTEFLRNYQLDARTTARGILFGLINHVNKNVLVTQARGRWVAVLPKNSPQIWQLSPNQMLNISANGIKLSDEGYADDTMQGFYLRDQKEAPCGPNITNCHAHTASFLETPPVSSWRRLKLTTPGIGKDSVKVFVSGYSAKALGDNVFEYWGQERVKANVTILQNGRLLLRAAVTGSSSTSAILGRQSLSRR